MLPGSVMLWVYFSAFTDALRNFTFIACLFLSKGYLRLSGNLSCASHKPREVHQFNLLGQSPSLLLRLAAEGPVGQEKALPPPSCWFCFQG